VHIITRQRLTDFGRIHTQADAELREWVRRISQADYSRPSDVRIDFPSMDFIRAYRAAFNVHHNHYRLVVDMRFDLGRVYIRHVVTHAQYTRLMKRGEL
jgi:mRNA interferase HigB